MTELWPEPIWPLYLRKREIEEGVWIRIEPDDVITYAVNPFADNWRERYTFRAIAQLEKIGWPRDFMPDQNKPEPEASHA